MHNKTKTILFPGGKLRLWSDWTDVQTDLNLFMNTYASSYLMTDTGSNQEPVIQDRSRFLGLF